MPVLKKFVTNHKPKFLPRIGKLKKGEAATGSGWGDNISDALRIHPETEFAEQLKNINPSMRIDESWCVLANPDPLDITYKAYKADHKQYIVCDGEHIIKERGDTQKLETLDTPKPCQRDKETGICKLCSGKSKGKLQPVKAQAKLDVILLPRQYAFGYFELLSTSEEVDQPEMYNLVETIKYIAEARNIPIMQVPFKLSRKFDSDFQGRYQKDGVWVRSKNPQSFLHFEIHSDYVVDMVAASLGAEIQKEIGYEAPKQLSEPPKALNAVPENFTKFSGIINKIKETPDKAIYANVEKIYTEFDWVGASPDDLNNLFTGYKSTYLDLGGK